MTLAEFRTRVRAYANDPSTSGTLGKTGVNELFPDAIIDEIGAEEYKQCCNLLRRHSPGFFVKTLVTATSSTQQNSWPSDFIRLKGPMVVSDDGTSLEGASGEAAGEEVTKGVTGVIHSTLAQSSNTRIYVPEQGGFRLYPKPTTAGSKALLLRYEYEPDFGVTGTDVLLWPNNHSTMLVIRTAVTLRDIAGFESGRIGKNVSRLEQDLMIDLKTVDLDTDQFPSSYYDDVYPEVSKQGKVR